VKYLNGSPAGLSSLITFLIGELSVAKIMESRKGESDWSFLLLALAQ